MLKYLSRKGALTLALSSLAVLTFQSEAMAKAFYVSPNGDGSTGANWKTAWQAPDKIDWNQVNAGDQIILDGGTTGITYQSELVVPKSGSAAAPITIRQANGAGHNGQVILFGNASATPTPPPYPGLKNGISIGGSYINVVGAQRSGIKIKSYHDACINIAPGQSNINLRNIEFENRIGLPPYGVINCVGLKYSGYNVQVANCDFRECNTGAREVAQEGSNNLTVFRNCTFGSNRHYLNFQRGCGTGIAGVNTFQFKGNYNSTTYALSCIFGTHLTFALSFSKGNVQVNNCLYLAHPMYANYFTFPAGSTDRVRINRCTFITPSQPGTPPYGMLGGPIYTTGSGDIKVSNSVVYGGSVQVPVTQNINGGGNIQFRVAGNTTALAATLVDPQFKDEAAVAAMPSDYEPYQFALLDYSPLPGAPSTGKGSTISSVSTLVAPYGPRGKILPLGGP